MPRKEKKSFSASSLRNLLAGLIILVAAASLGVFFYARGVITEYAGEVNSAIEQASTSGNDLEELQNLQLELDKYKDISQKAASLVISGQTFEHQNIIISTLTSYANNAGVTITEYGFQDSTANAGPQSSGSGGENAANPAPSITGARTIVATVNLATPASYENLLRFIYAIENGPTKMQLSSISLARNIDGGNSVNVETLNIEVYVRE